MAYGGDYFLLDRKLDEIGEARYPDDIEKILERADENRAEVIKRQVRELNKDLTPDEIRDVNDLLVWVIRAYYDSVPISLLESVLRLKTQKAQSFVPLEKQIKDRYSPLFAIEGLEEDGEQ